VSLSCKGTLLISVIALYLVIALSYIVS
jgi:hypothetical protein